MSRKTKRLARVVEARRRVRDRRAAEYAGAESRLRERKQTREELQGRRALLFESLADRCGEPMSASLLEQFDRQRKMWSRAIQEADTVVDTLEAEAESTRTQLMESARRLRTCEELHSRSIYSDRKREEKNEQRMADDLNGQRSST